jgi:transposase InsO family protein
MAWEISLKEKPVPWKETSVMDQKLEFILLWKSRRFSITALSEMFCISRPTAYKFIKRYETSGAAGLIELPRAPRKAANKTSNQIEKELLALREEHPRWGAAKLLVLLEHRLPNEKLPCVATVNLILKRNGLIRERKSRKKTEPRYPIFDPGKPNEVWSADFKGKFRLGNKQYCYPLTIADSASRYVFAAKGMYSPNTDNTKPVFIDVFRRYGLPEQIHTDNGAPFAHINSLGRLSKLSVWFMELGIQPVFSDPAHPEQNSRHERMHRELKGEATRPPGSSLQAQQRKLNTFVKEYNELRPHDSLVMKTPAAVHTFSSRPYPERIKEWIYPKNFHVRYVSKNGAVRIGMKNWLFITTALAGKEIEFEEIGNRIYRIYFRDFFLGYSYMKELKVYDIMAYRNELKV